MRIKINNISIDNAEDLDIIMPIYNLSEYSNNYSMTPGSRTVSGKVIKMLAYRPILLAPKFMFQQSLCL